MDCLSLKLCDIQGRLFELVAKEGYDCDKFVAFFMGSDVAKGLDSRYNRLQWAGEEYLLEEILAASGAEIPHSTEQISKDLMYWVGYIYRYWHYYKNEPSKKIYSQANFKTMKRNYMMFHTMDPSLAIDDLIEMKEGKGN